MRQLRETPLAGSLLSRRGGIPTSSAGTAWGNWVLAAVRGLVTVAVLWIPGRLLVLWV